MMLGSDGATARAPIEPVGWSSKIGVQVWPKSVVFHTPPLLTPIRNSFGLPGMPVAPTVRPPRNGPMHRHLSAEYALESNGGAAKADDPTSMTEQTGKMTVRH